MALHSLRQLAVTPLWLCVVACAGRTTVATHQKTAYDRAYAVLDACCDRLTANDQMVSCKQGIPRVDPAEANDGLNRETFSCVADRFVCDPTTGKATKDSAQAQLECIDDLRSTRAISP